MRTLEGSNRVRNGLMGIIILVMVIGGCFLALLPARTTLHDKLAGTAVYPADLLRARNSFEPLVRATTDPRLHPTPVPERSDDPDAFSPTASSRTAYPTAAVPQARDSEPQNTSA